MVLFVPVHTVALPAMLPPTDAGLTVTVAVALFAAEHAPLVITALYWVVAVRLVAVYVVAVFAMSVQVVPSGELCHFVIVPV